MALSHNVETERALIGGLILAPAYIQEVLGILTPEDMARPAHRTLLEILIDLAARHPHLDAIVLDDELERRGMHEQCGGHVYVHSLTDACPSVASLPVYAARIKEHSTRRRLELAYLEGIEEVQAGEKDTETLLESAEARVYAICRGGSTAKSWGGRHAGQAAMLANVEQRSGRQVTGITTGLVGLDTLLCGWQATDLVILAARPAMGKTCLALNFAMAAARTGTGVGILSMEMSEAQLDERLACAYGKVDASRVRTGDLSSQERQFLRDASAEVGRLPIWVDDTAGLTMAALRAKARKLKYEHPELGLIVVDYLQLMQGAPGTKQNREGIISEISRGLKVLAKDLNVPVIALSQLNRNVEGRTDQRPKLADLRESGAIEQDADVVLFIYRDEVVNESSSELGIAEIGIAKQRAGKTGIVKVAFSGVYQTFSDLTKREPPPSERYRY